MSSFFDVDTRTIERYLKEKGAELKDNGYEILTSKRLHKFKEFFDTDINVGIKTRRLGVFNFKSILDLGMLLKESDNAKSLRGLILDIALDVVSKKSGGTTKYINQRDETYLLSLYAEENYRKEFLIFLKKRVLSNYFLSLKYRFRYN